MGAVAGALGSQLGRNAGSAQASSASHDVIFMAGESVDRLNGSGMRFMTGSS